MQMEGRCGWRGVVDGVDGVTDGSLGQHRPAWSCMQYQSMIVMVVAVALFLYVGTA